MRTTIRRRAVLVVLGLALIGLVLGVPSLDAGLYLQQLAVAFSTYALLALSLQILLGFAGQFSLGQVGLYALGAYTTGVLSTTVGIPVWASVPAAVIAGGILGALLALPALRVRGFYLSIVTYAFTLLVHVVLVEARDITGGVRGIPGIPSSVLQTLCVGAVCVSSATYYYMVLIVLGVALLATVNLRASHLGRGLLAIRENELVARTMGINTGVLIILAFCIAGMYAALAGAIYAHAVSYLSPDAFDFDVVILTLAMPIVGGLSSALGPLLGAGFLTVLPQVLSGFTQFNSLIYGLILLGTLVFMPGGIAGLGARTTPVRARSGAKENLLSAGTDPALLTVVRGEPGEHTGQAQPEFLLEARDLSISFGGLAALTNVNLQVRPRTIHGLIGPNGSGKSTLVNVITGLYRPGGGAVCLEGEPISGRPPHEIARRGIGRTYQAPNLCRSMSVLENVLLGRAVHFRAGGLACLVHSRAMRREEERNLRVCRGLLGALGLSEVASARPESLPFGLQRVLEVARAVAMEPRLLLLDEPAAGLSPGELEGLELILRRLRDSGMTILLIEHNVELVMRVCDVVTVIDTGEVICTGRPDVVRQDPRTLAAYLGTAP